jgi:thiol:disulfide interchange protein DsbD
MEGQLFYQACSTNACLPPEQVPIRIPISIAPEGATAKLQNQDVFDSGRNIFDPPAVMSRWRLHGALWLTLLAVFLGGLALNLTPCIYPLIPITVSYFGGRRRKNGGRVFVHGILYISGLSVTNSILGVAASLSGGMLGSALQEPIVLLAVAGILISLALSFFGFWELRLPSGLTRVASKNVSGYFGTFFMGLTLGVLAAPCVGPFVLGLLTFVGQKGDPFLGFLYFFVLSLGLGLPLTVIALFSSILEKLPMSGEWMIWIRKALGWVLVGMAGYFLKPLMASAMGGAAVLAAVFVAAGLHLGWLEPSSRGGRVFFYFRRALGVILIAGSIIFFLVASRSRSGIDWIPYSPTIVTEAAQKQDPMILDFYADWCGPCVTLDKKVFRDPEIVKASQYLVPVRVNLTQRHSLQDKLLERYQIRGVPTIIFINRRGLEEKEMRIESYVSRNEVLTKMKQLIEKP